MCTYTSKSVKTLQGEKSPNFTKIAGVGPQKCWTEVLYAGVRHYGDGVHSPQVASTWGYTGTLVAIMLVLKGTRYFSVSEELTGETRVTL